MGSCLSGPRFSFLDALGFTSDHGWRGSGGGRPSLRMTTKTSLQTTPTKHTFDALTQLFWRHFKDVIIVFTVFLLFCLFIFFLTVMISHANWDWIVLSGELWTSSLGNIYVDSFIKVMISLLSKNETTIWGEYFTFFQASYPNPK